jgi:hypothetical protein
MNRLLTLALAGLALAVGPLSQTLAGTPGGPTQVIATCMPTDTDTYTFYFDDTGPAVVELKGDGDTDLDLFVYDLSGRLVAGGDGPTDHERVSWSPPPGGRFYKVVVKNLGGVYNRYRLATN